MESGSDLGDVIRFGQGIGSEELDIYRTDNLDLMISVRGQTDSVRVVDWYFGGGAGRYQIEAIEFADGTRWESADIASHMTVTPGTDQSETVYGTDRDDVLDGLGGFDVLLGGAGNDVYVIDGGSGNKRIRDGGNVSDVDVVRFGEGIGLDDIQLEVSGYDLLIYVTGTGQWVTISGWFQGDVIERFEFSDGAVLTQADVETLILSGPAIIVGSAYADNLYGSMADDTIYALDGEDSVYASGGNDLLDGGTDGVVDRLTGGKGDDIYVFGRGYGIDYVYESTVREGVDAIEFTDGVRFEDLTFARSLGSIHVGIAGTDDALILVNCVQNGNSIIEELRFSDGTVFDLTDIDAVLADVLQLLPATDDGDWLYGGNGDEYLDGRGGADKLYGNGGNDTLTGDG